MFKKFFSLFVLMFLLAIAIPVLAQRYDSCDRRVGGRGQRVQRYDRDRNYGYARNDYGRRNRRVTYAPVYYPQSYYAPSSYYTVRRRPPVRRYDNYGYRPRYSHRNRGRISFSIGF